MWYNSEMTGKQLKKRRADLKLTQKELALKLQVEPNTLARWERELRVIPAFLDLALQTVELAVGGLKMPGVDLTASLTVDRKATAGPMTRARKPVRRKKLATTRKGK
jgi:transcriptional regulator with XRE-family HTH domain